MPRWPGEKDLEGSKQAEGVGSKGPHTTEVKDTLPGTGQSMH